MKRITALFISLCLYAGVTYADNTGSSCSRYKGTSANTEILNAIGAGKIKQLVACGFDVNQSVPLNGEAITPLQLVASMDKPALIEELIGLGADPNLGGNDEIGLYPLELALSTRKYDAAQTLIKNKARADYVLPQSRMTSLMTLTFDKEFESKAVHTMNELIAHGADVNATDKNGDSPLHWAARTGNVKYVAQLLKVHANACAQNKQGKKPVDVIRKHDIQLQAALLRACSKVN